MIRLSPGLLQVFVLLASSVLAPSPAYAQFKEVGPPPFSTAIARQKIRTSLQAVDPGNPQRTVDSLLALVPWYRDLLDQELIAAWQKDGRANLTQVIGPLADAAVATAIVDYSWRKAPDAAFQLAFAPLLGQLMERYPDSAQPFAADLLASRPPDLSTPVAEAVCRILIDMPDVGTWRKTARQVLPHYRPVAERLLTQDLHGDDQEKSYRARIWLAELQGEQPGIGNQPLPRRKPAPPPPTNTGRTNASRNAPLSPPSGTVDGRPTLRRADTAPPPPDPTPAPSTAPPPPAPTPPTLYSGPRSGTLQCGGSPVPQNAEFVFRDLPTGKMQLDYDTKIWDARLAPAEAQTQKLILRNKSSGPQKRCVVHWTLSP